MTAAGRQRLRRGRRRRCASTAAFESQSMRFMRELEDGEHDAAGEVAPGGAA